MFVDEVEAIRQLADREVLIRDEGVSVERLKRLPPGRQILFEPPIKLYSLPGLFDSCGRHTFIGRNCDFAMVSRVGSFCAIASDVQIGKEFPPDFLSTNSLFYAKDAPTGFGPESAKFKKANREQIAAAASKQAEALPPGTTISNDVWIGARAVIAGGVKIGPGAIIAAGAVVTRNVGAYQIVGGVPARLIRKRFPEEVIKRMLALRWWNYELDLFTGVDVTDPEAALDIMEGRLAEDEGRYTLARTRVAVRRDPGGELKIFKLREKAEGEA